MEFGGAEFYLLVCRADNLTRPDRCTNETGLAAMLQPHWRRRGSGVWMHKRGWLWSSDVEARQED